jgi:hypothetical protein
LLSFLDASLLNSLEMPYVCQQALVEGADPLGYRECDRLLVEFVHQLRNEFLCSGLLGIRSCAVHNLTISSDLYHDITARHCSTS